MSLPTPAQVRVREDLAASLPSLETKVREPGLSPADRLTALFRLLLAYQSLGQRQEQLDAAKEIVQLEQSAKSYYTLGEAYRYVGFNREACRAFETAYTFPRTNLPPEIVRMIEDRYVDALYLGEKWREARTFLFSKYRSANTWPGNKCARVAFYIGGGFGDVMFFARLTDLAKKLVRRPLLVLPRSEVKGLLIKPYPEDFRQFLASQDYEIGDERSSFGTNLVCPTELLCPILKLDPAGSWANEIPLWQADPALTEKYAVLRTPSRPLYGLCWRGECLEGQMYLKTGIHRQLTEEQAQQIISATSANADWVSLQQGKTLPGLQAPPLNTWAETAAVIANLDAVVTVDTSVMHLAAAMGKPTFVLLSGPCDRKFLADGDSCPFYPSMKLFRSTYSFDGAVEAVIHDIFRLTEETCALQKQL
jgi:hypothetical protein